MKPEKLILWACLVLLYACRPSVPETRIEGKITGLPNDTLFVNYCKVSDLKRANVQRDTIVAHQGEFSYLVEADSVPVELYIYPNPGTSSLYRSIQVIAFPGEKATVTGSLTDYKVSGNPFHVAYETFKSQCKPYKDKLNAVTDVLMDLQQKGEMTPQRLDSLRLVYEPIVDELSKFQADYIRRNPGEDVSAFVLAELGGEYGDELFPLLSEEVRTGTFGELCRAIDNLMKERLAREEAKSKIIAGAEAPDFTLPDIDGKNFTLSALRGKYVVLDFWGSWCGWCIKGIPDMKKYYEKYKDRMEIVGIDCNDPEDKWKAAVEKHQLPWTHVRNAGSQDVTVMYAIQGYPTKVVIDPQGKIAHIGVGEDPSFYAYLDDLFKK